VRPNPLTHDNLLNLFKGDAVGRDVVLQPATMEDMWVEAVPVKASLEVVYEGA
jgi:chlorophyllide a reductase subunit X